MWFFSIHFLPPPCSAKTGQDSKAPLPLPLPSSPHNWRDSGKSEPPKNLPPLNALVMHKNHLFPPDCIGGQGQKWKSLENQDIQLFRETESGCWGRWRTDVEQCALSPGLNALGLTLDFWYWPSFLTDWVFGLSEAAFSPLGPFPEGAAACVRRVHTVLFTWPW